MASCWAAIRVVLVTVLILAWFTKQIGFVLAYTQADVECELYMAIPKGFEVEGDYVLKLKKNLLGQKQAGRVWNQHLVTKLKPNANTSMVETVAISGDIFRMDSFVLKDKPIEQGPFAHCDDDKEVVITDKGKRLSDAKTR